MGPIGKLGASGSIQVRRLNPLSPCGRGRVPTTVGVEGSELTSAKTRRTTPIVPTRYRIGVDIGGTFTDATLVNEASGEVRIGKVLTTPHDPSDGFLSLVRRMVKEAGILPGDLSFVVHATTVATNAIIEGKIARTGFVTTDGFRDMLEIARQIRPSLYDLQFEKPPPLVPRYLCFGVPERLDAMGAVVRKLDEKAVRQIAAALKKEDVEAVAVCLLHSYRNPAHERRVGEILRKALPGVLISISADVAPEFREYFRASTTVINASVRPTVGRYLRSIEKRLRDDGVDAELLVMQSSGGVFTFSAASERPVFMVESGPAAGAVSAAHLGRALGYDNVLSFDMGGTTAKLSLIQGGQPRVTKDYTVGAAAQRSAGAFGGAAGYPIRTPVVDLVEIGAGGGSIAWVDSGGALRVGPHSAGADPGPACYGLGGGEPTITDANLALGRLASGYFLGGEMKLDAVAARKVIQDRCAGPLELKPDEAANGIIEIANTAMVNALRLVSVQRGYDPREYVLIAFGGAGPMHANRLAEEAGVEKVLVPMSPGTFSALGLLVTDLRYDYSQTLIRRTDDLDPEDVSTAFEKLEEQGRAALAHAGVAKGSQAFERSIDMRYFGQSFELNIPPTFPLPRVASGRERARVGVEGTSATPALDANWLEALNTRFHDAHERAYGFKVATEPTEIVNLRVTAIGRISKPKLRDLKKSSRDPKSALKGARKVFFTAPSTAPDAPSTKRSKSGATPSGAGRASSAASGWTDTPVYDRYRLPAGAGISGPAIIEEHDSTTIILPGWQGETDVHGNLLLTRIPSPSRVPSGRGSG